MPKVYIPVPLHNSAKVLQPIHTCTASLHTQSDVLECLSGYPLQVGVVYDADILAIFDGCDTRFAISSMSNFIHSYKLSLRAIHSSMIHKTAHTTSSKQHNVLCDLDLCVEKRPEREM